MIGSQYLVDNYSLSTSIGFHSESSSGSSSKISWSNNDVFIAGISEQSPSFDAPNAPSGLRPLPQVQEEASAIKELSTNAKTILNEKFTVERFSAIYSPLEITIPCI